VAQATNKENTMAKFTPRAAFAACMLALSLPAAAQREDGWPVWFAPGTTPINENAFVPKSASAQTLGARATVTTTGRMYGGFELTSQTTVYIAVRGNSLGTLGVTQNYLDYPRVRVYSGSGADLITDVSGRPGFNSCLSSVGAQAPVISYYANVRHQALHSDDGCVGLIMSAGAYTFTVDVSQAGVNSGDSSVPLSGDVLFEVTLNP
jgi:hypothetical protein